MNQMIPIEQKDISPAFDKKLTAYESIFRIILSR